MEIAKSKQSLCALAVCYLFNAVLSASLVFIGVAANAQPDAPVAGQTTAVSVERLVAEFGPWVGNADDLESVATTLLSGRATQIEGAASVPPATGPLGYGEARLALKLAQGALVQQGVAHPDADQLRVALHGGELRTDHGLQTIPGVLPQKVQGTGWGAMATGYGLSAQDMLPPPRPHVARPVVQLKTKPAKATNGKSKASASQKGASKRVVAKQTVKKPVAASKAKKPVAKASPKKVPAKAVK